MQDKWNSWSFEAAEAFLGCDKHRLSMGWIRYSLFASADTGIYPKAKRGIAMLRVDKFPYPRQQTRGN